MSSKVRMVLFNSRVGKWYTGRHVWASLFDEAYRVGAKLPLATEKQPVWKRVLWLYDHAKSDGSKLYIWRELRRTPPWRSPYVQLAGKQLAKIGPKFTVAQMEAWELGRRRRDRERAVRQVAEALRRNREGRLRNLDEVRPDPPQAPRMRFRAEVPQNAQVQARNAQGFQAVVGNPAANLDWGNLIVNPFLGPAGQLNEIRASQRADNILLNNQPQRFRLNMNGFPEAIDDEVEQRAQRDREEGL